MESSPRVKMADVAARAGVSLATVSKVVNARYGVAPATIERVQGVIEEMGYVENLSASSLRRTTSNMIGVLVADFEPFSAELLKGAASAVHGTPFEVMAHAGGEAPAWERRSLARLAGTLIDGAIIVTPTVLETSNGFPVVAIDPHYGPNVLPTVDADSYGGAKELTEYLLGLGHRRIAMLGGRQELDSQRLREAGFRDAMAAADVPVVPELVRETRFQPGMAREIARELLTLDEPPTAIFAFNDITALQAQAVALELGLDVPGDVSIAGFDDVPDAALSKPRLTTVRQPLQEMGRAAMEMLMDIVAGNTPERHLRVPTELVVRESTAPPRQ